MPFIPHTEAEVKAMLTKIGVNSIADLFQEIPAKLQIDSLQNIPSGMSEMQTTRFMKDLATKDQGGLCFIGAGAYEHHIPAAVWDITSRGEFMTSYTPYQAEASQGNLQLIYEYQTMMASLMGVDVSNASLYEGASAVAEAVLMAVRVNRKVKSPRILMLGSLNPNYQRVVQAIVKQQGIELITVPFAKTNGCMELADLQNYNRDEFAAVIIPQPNFFGLLENVDELTNWAHNRNAIVIAVVNPIAMALLKEPGQWGTDGADIVCGEGQALGVPLASGGPYFGFLCCKQEFVRQLPGRLVGQTVDMAGKVGYALTLQAREQHIRRAKATSNICTNQGLLVTAATIYMSLLGPQGLRQVAMASHANTRLLLDKLTRISQVEIVFNKPYFHEQVIRVPQSASKVLAKLADLGVQGGYDLSHDFPELGNCILLCATETKTEADLEYYAKQLATVLK